MGDPTREAAWDAWRRGLRAQRAGREAQAEACERGARAMAACLPLLHGTSTKRLPHILAEGALRATRRQPTDHAEAFGWPDATYLSFGYAWPDRQVFLSVHPGDLESTATPFDSGLIWRYPPTPADGCVAWVHARTIPWPAWMAVFPEWVAARFPDPLDYFDGEVVWPDPEDREGAASRLRNTFEVRVTPGLDLKSLGVTAWFATIDFGRALRRTILPRMAELGWGVAELADGPPAGQDPLASRLNAHLRAEARDAIAEVW